MKNKNIDIKALKKNKPIPVYLLDRENIERSKIILYNLRF